MDSDADAGPAATGLNVTNSAQLRPTASDATQAFCKVKFAAPAPVIETAEIFKGAVPLLLSTTACAGDAVPGFSFAKLKDVKFSFATGAGAAVATPVNGTVCCAPVALSMIESAASKFPAVCGL